MRSLLLVFSKPILIRSLKKSISRKVFENRNGRIFRDRPGGGPWSSETKRVVCGSAREGPPHYQLALAGTSTYNPLNGTAGEALGYGDLIPVPAPHSDQNGRPCDD